MSFRDFISNWRYRRRIDREFARFQRITPPENPSRRYIDKLVRQLLDERKSAYAFKKLQMVGAAAVPSLRDALHDDRFRVAVREEESWHYEPPLDTCLELLVPHDAETVLSVAAPLAASGSKVEQRAAALHLASLGDVRTLPILNVLLQDEDGYVRSSVTMGCSRACSSGRATQEFRAGAYDLLLLQCDQRWSGTLNDAPRTVIELDHDRAAADLSSQRFLSASNPCVANILSACNDANIVLPASLVQDILDQSLPHAGENSYPHDRIAAACLVSLALSMGEAARPLLERAVDHGSERIQEAAGEGLVRLAGIDDPFRFVWRQVEDRGIESLTDPQRTVYFANVFDYEVCNGGLMQYFGNSSGDYVCEALAALRELRHEEAERALVGAVDVVGPLVFEQQREVRMAAFEGRYEELVEMFRPLEEAFYRSTGRFRQKVLLYAAEQAAQFGGGGAE